MSRGRGRSRGRNHKLADIVSINYLIILSQKYGIDLNDLFNRIKEAWEHQESTINDLSIECRMKTQKNAILLITKDLKTIALFPVPTNIFRETNPLKKYRPPKILNKKIPDTIKIDNPQIKDLKYGMNRINLKVKIVEIPKPRSVFTKYGKLAMVTNAVVTDETGVIQLPLWNQQIDGLEVGDRIQIKNGRVGTFRGEPQLRIDKGGQLSIIEKSGHITQI